MNCCFTSVRIFGYVVIVDTRVTLSRVNLLVTVSYLQPISNRGSEEHRYYDNPSQARHPGWAAADVKSHFNGKTHGPARGTSTSHTVARYIVVTPNLYRSLICNSVKSAPDSKSYSNFTLLVTL